MLKRRTLSNGITYTMLAVFGVIILFPYYWMVSCAIRLESDLFVFKPKLWVSRFTMENFKYVIFQTRIPQYMLNSLIISITATFMCLVVSLPAGYALARFSFKGKKMVSSGILLIKLLPTTACLIPLYMILSRLHLLDMHFTLSFLHLLPMVPFTIWMARGFIKTVPVSIEEAAIIDGCSKLQMFVFVLVPTVASGIFAIAIYAFMLSWEEFLFAYTFTGSKAKTVSVGIALFMGEHVSLWGAIMASAVLMGFPMLFFFMFAQKNFIKGMVSGAIKG